MRLFGALRHGKKILRLRAIFHLTPPFTYCYSSVRLGATVSPVRHVPRTHCEVTYGKTGRLVQALQRQGQIYHLCTLCQRKLPPPCVHATQRDAWPRRSLLQSGVLPSFGAASTAAVDVGLVGGRTPTNTARTPMRFAPVILLPVRYSHGCCSAGFLFDPITPPNNPYTFLLVRVCLRYEKYSGDERSRTISGLF